VQVDGKELVCDTPPVVEQGRVLVPLRAIFEALGASVEWDGSTQTVTGRKEGTTVRLVIGQGTAYVNERPVSLDVPGKIINGRTMVPLRFIGESLGAEVNWDGTTRTVIVRTGAGAQQDKDTVTEYFITPEGEVVSPKRITIKDSMGRTVRVPSPPQRIVSVNSDVTELICAFGEEKRIVGVSDTADFPPLVKEKAKVGAAFTPNVEKILALRPDVVFGYGNFLKPEIIAQIERAGIPVVLLDCYKLSTMSQDIRTLGTILGRQKEAEAYIAYFEKYQKLFAERTKEIPLNKRPLVYLEGYTDYSGTGPGSGGAEMLECVGARSICAGLRIPYPKVNAEWVVAQNPQVVIKACGSSIPSGYGESSEAMAKKRAEIMRRPGWDKIAAVKQEKVFMLSSEIYTGPRAIVGMAYMAKWIYPDLFPDVDPSAIHREMLKKFHNLDLEGAYAYPEM
uniref:stalk domain-containing protein n=1 Tax=Desulfovirgula thermocuniculi TaxID=348842 RepID=UPI000481B308